MGDIRALEHSTLKVPYEVLNKKFRFAQKTMDKEIDVMHKNGIAKVDAVIKRDNVKVEEWMEAVDALLGNLDTLTQKTSDAFRGEYEAAKSIHQRIKHLQTDRSDEDSVESEEWRRQRVDRLIIDYLLRSGYYQTGSALANVGDLNYITNISLFLTAQEVEDSLRRHETTRCLEWCYDNRSKLRRLHSRLELRLRQQEFIELVRRNERTKAVQYARQYMKDCDVAVWREELSEILGLLAFTPDTQIPKYKDLFSEERWNELITEFGVENFRLYQLAHQSVFSAALQSGLSALKTPHCSANGCSRGGFKPSDSFMSSSNPSGGIVGGGNRKCPICSEAVIKLASPLPYAHASQSRLVCPYTGDTMNEDNPAMMLPNG